MDRVLQVAHVERFYLHIIHLVELILVGIDRHLSWQEVGMGKIVALAGCHLSLEDYRHLLGGAIGEVEIILAGLYGEQLAGAIKLCLQLSLHIGQWHYALALVLVGISRELEGERTQHVSILVGYERESLVAHGNPHRIGKIARHHDIARHVCQAHRHTKFLLVGLVERHHQPEDAAESEKEQEYQQLLVDGAKKEFAECTE